MNEKVLRLTKYTPGSVREVWTLALPLVLSAMSGSLMQFFDRLILANHSTQSMNAAASAMSFIALFQYGAIAVAAIGEVYVGKANGAGKFDEVASPAWQMIYFSFFCSIIFVPVGLFAGKIILPEVYQDQSISYFKWIMVFGFLFPMLSALAGFYIGIGKVHLITISAVICNILNIFLAYILIFGIDGYIPGYGVEGAAISTVISQAAQVLILFVVFLNNKNNQKYNTRKASLDLSLFKQCLKVGGPNSVGHMVEMAGWALLIYALAEFGTETHFTMFSLGQGFMHLFFFITEGYQKAVISVSSNYLGAKYHSLVKKSYYSGVKLQIISSIVLAIFLIIFAGPLVGLFFDKETIAPSTETVIDYAMWTLFWIWLYFLLDGLVWITAGVLTTLEDTKFTMYTNILNVWLFAIVPVYYFVIQNSNSHPLLTWAIVNCYAFININCFYLRYKSKIKILLA